MVTISWLQSSSFSNSQSSKLRFTTFAYETHFLRWYCNSLETVFAYFGKDSLLIYFSKSYYTSWEVCMLLAYRMLFLFLLLFSIFLLLRPLYFCHFSQESVWQVVPKPLFWQNLTAYFERCVRRQTKLTWMWEEIMSHNVQFKNGSVYVRETRGTTFSCPKGWHCSSINWFCGRQIIPVQASERRMCDRM